MTYFATKLSKSGLCDRLVDITLHHAVALSKGKQLRISSHDLNVVANNFSFSESRRQDTLYENMKQCITFAPSIVVDGDCSNEESCNEYYGGCRPIVSLYDSLFGTNSEVSLDAFLREITQPILQFREEFVKEACMVEEDWIGLHLRRTDKVSSHPDFGQMNGNELSTYNERTYIALEGCIARGINKFYIASDEESVCLTFAQYLRGKGCEVATSQVEGWKKTYVDLYNLSRCRAIIMSCRHSNFSIIPALLGGRRKVITVWTPREAKEYMTSIVQWNAVIDFIPYCNVAKTKIAMLGHQGVADFYNQNGLYHVIASSYFDVEVTMLIRSESDKKMTHAMFPGWNVEVANTLQTQTNTEFARACLVCHTCHEESVKTCVAHAPVRFVNEPYYEERGVYLILLNGFEDYPSWCKVYCNGRPFNVAFYMYNGFQEHVLRSRFSIPYENIEQLHKEEVYDIMCHDDPQRGFSLPVGGSVFKCNQKSAVMMDLLGLFHGAKEFHFIDSSYSVMIWCCQHKYNWFKDKKICLHNSCRGGRDISIYTHRLPGNWQVV
jgi:hypothetical protein